MLMHTGKYLEEHIRDCRQGAGLGVLGKRSGVETPPCSVIPGTDERREETLPSEVEKHENQVLYP